MSASWWQNWWINDGTTKSADFRTLGTMNVITTYPIVVEIFLNVPKRGPTLLSIEPRRQLGKKRNRETSH